MKQTIISVLVLVSLLLPAQHAGAQLLGVYSRQGQIYEKVYESSNYLTWNESTEAYPEGYIKVPNGTSPFSSISIDLQNFSSSLTVGDTYDVFLGTFFGEDDIEGYYMGRTTYYGDTLLYFFELGCVVKEQYYDEEPSTGDVEEGMQICVAFSDYDLAGALSQYSLKLIIYRVEE